DGCVKTCSTDHSRENFGTPAIILSRWILGGDAHELPGELGHLGAVRSDSLADLLAECEHDTEINAGPAKRSASNLAKVDRALRQIGRNGAWSTVARGDSDAHGHYDVAVAGGLVGEGAERPGGLLVFELEADRAVGSGGEEIQQVLGIEAD